MHGHPADHQARFADLTLTPPLWLRARLFCYDDLTIMNKLPDKMLTVGEINSTFAEEERNSP